MYPLSDGSCEPTPVFSCSFMSTSFPMKFISFFCLPLLFVLFAQTAQAQSEPLPKIMTDTLEVTGVCKMCKARIEEAVMYQRGVKLAEWSADAQQLRVIYQTKKTNRADICQAVAEVGHDTELVKATDEAYQELPGCCRYRDGVKVH